MDTVSEFVRLRREGKVDEAITLLAPNASLGAPWGGQRYGENVKEFLRDEVSFVKKGYLRDCPVEKIDDNTYQRKFQWDRGMFEYGNSGTPLSINLPKWREMYFLQDGKIRLVVSSKQPQNKSLLKRIFGI